VAQSVGADYLGPFTFNAARSLIAFFALLLASALFRALRRRRAEYRPPSDPAAYRRELLLGGALSGIALTMATNLQQKGIETTTAGKAGFITALYIVIVPVLGLFLNKRVTWTVWLGVAIAVFGLYFLCIQDGFLHCARGMRYILLLFGLLFCPDSVYRPLSCSGWTAWSSPACSSW
jgi:drug/metabolite transporter (DMT)-like permease